MPRTDAIKAWLRRAFASAVLAGLGFAPAAAAPADFYRGKTITMILSADAGGGYALVASRRPGRQRANRLPSSAHL